MNEYYVAWWNLENLLDVEHAPQRPSQRMILQLAAALPGWTQQLLDKKISQLAKIILQMNGNNGPDILGVCEVENKPVSNSSSIA